jgi:hypothetical protein
LASVSLGETSLGLSRITDFMEVSMALKVGRSAPDLDLESHLGRRIRLKDYHGKCNVALIFFPLAWTPI